MLMYFVIAGAINYISGTKNNTLRVEMTENDPQHCGYTLLVVYVA